MLFVLYTVFVALVYFVTLERLEKLITVRYVNHVLRYFVPFLLMTHVICISGNLTGVATQFNQVSLQILTFKCEWVDKLVNNFLGKDHSKANLVMRTGGYESTSPVHNIGSLILYIAFLPVANLIVKIASSFSSSGLQEDTSQTTRACFFLNKNLTLKTYVNFLAGYQVIFVVSS